MSSDEFNAQAEIKRVQDSLAPHNISKIMCETINTQVGIRNAIENIFNEALLEKVGTQKNVKAIAKAVFWEEFWKKLAAILVTVSAIMLGTWHYFFK